MTIELGMKFRDKVTGFTGIAIARTQWLNGCERVTLQPSIDKDGKRVDGETFDVQQLEFVDNGILPREERETKTGGPIPNPVRNPDPKYI